MVEQSLDDRQRDVQTATEALRSAEARVNQLEERQRMIEQLAGAVPAAGEGAQALLAAATQPLSAEGDDDTAEVQPLEGVVDIVSRLIRVPDGLEAAIEAALAEQLTAIVVERAEDAFAAIEYLQEQGAGTATLLPLDSMEHRYPLNLFNERGVVGIAARLVRCEQRYRPLIDTLLGRVIVVDDLRVARQMITRGLGSVVTRDGVMLRHDGAAFGGRAGVASEQFSMQRELDGLPEQIGMMREGLVDVRTRVQDAGSALQDARAAVESARRSVDENEDRRRQQREEFAALRRRQAKLSAETSSVRMTLAATDAGESETALRQRVDEAGREIEAVAAAIARLRDRSAAVGEERDAASEQLTEATTQHATVEAERRALAAQRDERLTARRVQRERRAHLETQLRELLTETEDLELSLQDRRSRLANNRAALTEAQAEVGPAHTALADVVAEERELVTSRTDAQNAQLQSERELMESEASLREQAARVQRLHEEIAEESMELLDDGRVRPQPAPARGDDGATPVGPPTAAEHAVAEQLVELVGTSDQVPVRGGAEVDLPALRERISELRGAIRSLGPVNVDALEDLSEERERHEFLSGQVTDLEAAENELRAAIKELRTLIRGRFDETFVEVNERFGEYFTRFFGGGQAELRLLENEEDDDEPGVEIFAQPPGKRIASLNVLSGGERSMTSVALLFALLSVNPAPMVLLDEVDAALDEANVGRFVDTLKELRDRSQFVVITHNRRTIEAADAIYGISMGDDSTSQVLSLRLSDLAATG
jgi:chromosome segregation protein